LTAAGAEATGPAFRWRPIYSSKLEKYRVRELVAAAGSAAACLHRAAACFCLVPRQSGSQLQALAPDSPLSAKRTIRRTVFRSVFADHLIDIHQGSGRSPGLVRSAEVPSINYLKKAAGAGMQWPPSKGWDERQMEETVFGKERSIEQCLSQFSRPPRPAPATSLSDIAVGLGRAPGREPGGASVQPGLLVVSVVAGEAGRGSSPGAQSSRERFVDCAGATIPLQDPETGTIWQALLFVTVLGASSYTWAQATRDQQLTAWSGSHIDAFENFPALWFQTLR
jgi:hypothetical protein